jgi:hypothetical protein
MLPLDYQLQTLPFFIEVMVQNGPFFALTFLTALSDSQLMILRPEEEWPGLQTAKFSSLNSKL